jgi:hypothetical protein
MKSRKPRGLARFRKREITRAFEGVPGATSIEIFPADGRIIVHAGDRTIAAPTATDFDKWAASHADTAQGS